MAKDRTAQIRRMRDEEYKIKKQARKEGYDYKPKKVSKKNVYSAAEMAGMIF